MKIRRPWFKFYPGDWLSSRRVALMKPAEKGVYIDLLAICWQEGSIPADPDELAYLLRLSKREFRAIWETVSKHFQPTDDPHFLTNRRIEDERADANQKSENGRKAAETRWDDDADALQTQSGRNAIQRAEEREEKRESRSKTKNEIDPELAALWDEFNAARLAVIPGAHRLAPTEGSVKLLRDRLKAGETAQSVRHVIAVYANEARDAEKARHFNATTPFRPENFARALSQPAPATKKTPTVDLFPDGMTPHESPATARALHREAVERGYANHAERMRAEGRA